MIMSYESIEDAIEGCFGAGTGISDRSYVGGGDINAAYCLELSNGQKVFVKSNSLENRGFFEAESTGLCAIASTGAIKTPKLICGGCDRKKSMSFLIMEMIERGRPAKDCWEVFAGQLAAMHASDTDSFVSNGRYGFTEDNYIGSSKQINTCKDTWIGFFVECRLEPQFRMASRYFDREITDRIIKFLDHIDDILTEPDKPSLIHGDLWTGNIITDNDGRAMLIDPAVYVGHAEADIAMTELFGRLPESFYRSYRDNNTIREGYEERRDIYNLYHLLNHLNLFGSSYLRPVLDTVIRRGKK